MTKPQVHLPDNAVPALFSSGTRDNLALPDDLIVAAARMKYAAVHELDGADHGFGVLMSSTRTREVVWV